MNCQICGKPLPARRRTFCSDKCSNRRGQVARYGLTPADYAILTEKKVCPICGRRVRKWNVDHDNKTGRVRGVICGTCNQRVLTALTTAQQAYNLFQYFVHPPAYALEGEPRMVGAIVANRKKRGWYR